jgi:transmembrane protein TMEM174 (potassium channel)
MSRTRFEALSDAVIAIIITIMVLELKVPHGTDWQALRPLVPVFLAYVLSEQPSPHAACDGARQRRHPLGEPASAVLAVARPVRDGLDGREPRGAPPDRALRRRAADGRHRLHHPADDHHGIPLAFVDARIAIGLYGSVALLRLVPDRRIERSS